MRKRNQLKKSDPVTRKESDKGWHKEGSARTPQRVPRLIGIPSPSHAHQLQQLEVFT